MHISIIDDERILAEKISKKLERHGYSVSTFYGYRDFLARGDAHSQLYLVDVSLGDGTGFDIVKWLRGNHKSKVPIILLSGYGDTQRIVCGLDLGADDYLTKPLVPDELVARVRAVLRRPENITTNSKIRFKNLSFDTVTKKVKIDGQEIPLTRNESLMLEIFLEKPGAVIDRERLVCGVWGTHRAAEVSDNNLSATLSNLRRKLGPGFSIKPLYNQGLSLE